jgi:RNA polymerase sigma factor (sigma-70 family)
MQEIEERTELGEWGAQVQSIRAAAPPALKHGEAAHAGRMRAGAKSIEPPGALTGGWTGSRDVSSWPDSRLIDATRRDPPDAAALDALVARYWKALFARCQLLTLNEQKASDLAQEAWCRILRARRNLKPDGNFFAYLAMTATNLWRDEIRSARRAGPLAKGRLISLDAAQQAEDGEAPVLAEVLPDPKTISESDQLRLKMDIDQALGALTPLLRDALVSRYVTGESCAEIGRRYGRTEQTVNGWVREAIQVMRRHLEDPPPGNEGKM